MHGWHDITGLWPYIVGFGAMPFVAVWAQRRQDAKKPPPEGGGGSLIPEDRVRV